MATLTYDVTIEVIVEDDRSGRGRVTVLRLAWRRSDPLAVNLLLTTQPDHPSLPRGDWMVLRDFLRYGLDEQTGDGDVRITPLEADNRVLLSLRGTGRPCEVQVPRPLLREFLDATELMVPAGEERSDEALDALIERLLRS